MKRTQRWNERTDVEIDGVRYAAQPVILGRRKNYCRFCAADGISAAARALCRRLPPCTRGRRADKRDVIWLAREGGAK